MPSRTLSSESQEDLPETVRLSKERVLKCLATELQEQQQVVRDKKMNKKYRMVKFFGKVSPRRYVSACLETCEWAELVFCLRLFVTS